VSATSIGLFEQTSEGEFLSGAPYANRYVMILGFRDGKVVRFQEVYDTLGFARALVPKSNAPKAKIPGLEVLAVERVDQAVQLLRNL